MKKLPIKNVHYKSAFREEPLPHDEVAYRVYRKGGKIGVVFSGINDGRDNPRQSTINAAEGIVEAICEVENLDPTKCGFFDLQTYKGYPSVKSGTYKFSKLKVIKDRRTKSVAVPSWQDTKCEKKVLKEWLTYIWDNMPGSGGVPVKVR